MARNLFKLWLDFVKMAVGLLEWFYRNSIITSESFSARLLKKWKSPLKVVIIAPLWIVEWILSCSMLLCGAFSSALAAFSPLFILLALSTLFTARSLMDAGEVLLVLLQVILYTVVPCSILLFAIHLLKKRFG